ncbi:DUF3857 domain-containing protein [Solitalea lacus]|uniref:DUF3857 domain-containing protein n=1 Tax=Solitalea lacus TaxID=2911172 RepID=UPI001ED9CF08|nr:DUF3857 domain-containing protein [Solitalea lacus]UKJ08639.1 DUF3857 domain-containing protein [Solitalea lacus]
MKKIRLLFIAVFSFVGAFAQENLSFVKEIPYKFGNVSMNELLLEKYDKDTSANAIVLDEFGESYIDDQDPSMLIVDYYGKLKIFNQKGQPESTIVIPLYVGGFGEEKVDAIQAWTYNLENGKIIKAKLAYKDFVMEKQNDKYNVLKFTFPMVKPGSVLEYKYTLKTPYYFYNFKEWHFQAAIPKVRSEYWAKIPGYFTYKITLKGLEKLTKNSSTVQKECFNPPGRLAADCLFLQVAMDSVPALKAEEFMTTLRNYLSRVEFEIEEFQYTNGSRKKFTNTWEDVERQLLSDPKFGPIFQKNQKFYQQLLKPEFLTITDSLKRATVIVDFLKKELSWNGKHGVLAENEPKDIWSKKEGSVAEINLFLIGMLKAAGLKAEPVILSTRENGYVNNLYPVLTDFNYVVARVMINNKEYLLDITEKMLPFGLLPLRCINNEGRLIVLKKSGWIKLVPNFYDMSQSIINMAVKPNGSVQGTCQMSKLYYQALNDRKEIARFSTLDDYVKAYQKKLTPVKISDFKIENVDSLSETLNTMFSFEMENEESTVVDKIYVNPYLFDKLSANPFKQHLRSYPIEFGTKKRLGATIAISIPDGYEVEYVPQNKKIVLPERNASYSADYKIDDNIVVIQSVLKLGNDVYEREYYQYFKELFGQIIKEQNETIILRKRQSGSTKSK